MPCIAVLDEDRDILSLITTVLADEGHEVVPCETGASLLSLAGTREVDLLLLDPWPLEVADGWRVASRARESAGRQIPVLMCTTRSQWESRPANVMLHHGVHVVTKPFNLIDLISSVEHALSGAPSDSRATHQVQMAGGGV